ncbi:hypothetical protein [Thalassoglobus sp.]|uniref:hypothetical protein n=1 Tax=Thalassoglobus sp. TaxID=2795869 RepID=UPI003AA9AC61
MGRYCNGNQAFCWETDANPIFGSQSGVYHRWEHGTLIQSGDPVSANVPFLDTLTLRMDGFKLSWSSFLSYRETVCSTNITLATLEYDPTFCGYLGELTHPGGPVGSYLPTMFIELYPYKTGSGVELTGKLWADDWDSDCWIRCTTVDGEWTFQKRRSFGRSPSTCFGLPEPTDGSCLLPMWLYTFPKTYTVSVPTVANCDCDGTATDINFSGILYTCQALKSLGHNVCTDSRGGCNGSGVYDNTLYRSNPDDEGCTSVGYQITNGYVSVNRGILYTHVYSDSHNPWGTSTFDSHQSTFGECFDGASGTITIEPAEWPTYLW